jgi:hypothetical protein
LVECGAVWPSDVDRDAPAFVALAALLCQYLHTTNNRMNVRPQGECFVAYLGRRAVTDRIDAEQPELVSARSGSEPAHGVTEMEAR